MVVEEARCAQRDGLAAGAELAAACSQDVLHPVRLRAIGQGDDVAVARAEDIDWCLVAAPGAAATVDDHAEAGHPGRVPSGGVSNRL